MAAEVVGTAFVRIRALTTGLSKDIERGLKKGAVDADVDSSGELVGDRFAKAAGGKIKTGVEGAVSDTTKNIDKKVDVDGGRKAGDRLGEAMRDGFTSVFDKTKGRIAKALGLDEAEGKKKGGLFGKGFEGGLRPNLLKIGLLFSPAILGAGSALIQYVVSLTAQIGFLAEAAAGAGVVLGGAFGVALAAVGPLFLAFKTETPRLKKFQEQAKKVGGAWKEVGAATQETLLPPLGEALNLTKRIIPIARGWGREVGRVVGEHAKVLATLLASEEGQRRTRSVLQQASPILDRMLDIGVRLFDIVFRLFEAALPSTQRFVDKLDQIIARWQFMTGALAGSGQLEATFERWRQRADVVFGALGDIAGAIWDIFTVGAETSEPFFENFAQWAEDFRNFTESAAGQNRLRQIFQDAHEVAHAFNGLIGDIIKRIGSGVFEPGGNEGILGFIGVLREDVVPFLDDFVRDLTGKYGDALTEFFETFGEFIRVLGESESLNSTLATLTLTFQSLTVTLETLMKIPGFGDFLGFLLGVGVAFGILKRLGITAIAGQLIRLFAFLGGIAWPVIASGVTSLALAFATILEGFGAGATAALVGGFAAAIAVILAVVAAIALLVIHWDKVKGAFAAVGRFLKDPMARLTQFKENLEDLMGSLGRVLGGAARAAGRALGKLASIIGGALSDALSSAGDALSELPGLIGDALSALGGAAVDALASFGSTILDALTTALSALPGLLRGLIVGAMQVAIQALFMYFIGIPILIGRAVTMIGPPIGRALADAFGVAIRFVTETLPTAIGAVLDFFRRLPGRVAGALAALGRTLVNVFTSAWNGLTNWLTNTAAPATLDFFTKLPGRIVSALRNLATFIANTFRSAMDGATRLVNTAVNGIVDFFVKLPGRITALAGDILSAAVEIGSQILTGIVNGLSGAVSFAGDIADAVRDALIDMINGLIDLLNDGIPDSLGWGPAKIDIKDNPIPKLALGGIFASPTTVQVGEAGREVVIPLTRPQRALELFNQSGLASVISQAQRARSANSSTATTTTNERDLTVNQHFYEKQDPKLMAAELAWQLP